jgi:hypothetical protein
VVCKEGTSAAWLYDFDGMGAVPLPISSIQFRGGDSDFGHLRTRLEQHGV